MAYSPGVNRDKVVVLVKAGRLQSWDHVTPEKQQDRGRLMRTIEVNQQVYITLKQQLEIAKIEELKERLLINILDFAEPAIEKSLPRRTLIVILSLLSGLMIGSIIILIQDTKKSRSL